MREVISKIFSKGEQEKWRHCLKPLLNMLQFCTHRLLTLHQPPRGFNILMNDMIDRNTKSVRRKEEEIKMATVLQTFYTLFLQRGQKTFTTPQAMSLANIFND